MPVACVSLCSTLKGSSGDEMVLGGAEGAPGNVLHHEFFECENRETQTSLSQRVVEHSLTLLMLT